MAEGGSWRDGNWTYTEREMSSLSFSFSAKKKKERNSAHSLNLNVDKRGVRDAEEKKEGHIGRSILEA